MIKNEVDFGVNNFGKINILSHKESIVQLFKNILFFKPGQLPSMPFIGVDILKYIYPMIDEGQLDDVAQKISTQCSELMPHMDFIGISVRTFELHGRNILLIIIPIHIEDDSETLFISVAKDKKGRVIFNYEFDESLI